MNYSGSCSTMNTIVSFFTVILTVSIGNTLKFRKSSIITPDDNGLQNSPNAQNTLPWSVPYYTDNQYGYITPVPPVINTIAPQMPPVTIGRVNTIISSPAPTETHPDSIATINNCSDNNSNCNNIGKFKQTDENTKTITTVTNIDSKYIFKYYPDVPPTPSSSNINSSTTIFNESVPIITNIVPKYFMTNPQAVTSPITKLPSSSFTTSSSADITYSMPTTVIVPPSKQNSLPLATTTSNSTISNTEVNSPMPVSSYSENNTSLGTTSAASEDALLSSVFNFTLDSTISTSEESTSSIIDEAITTMLPITDSSESADSLPIDTTNKISTAPEFRPLGLDCNYTPPVSTLTVINATSLGTGSNFQIEVPAVIKFDVNITSVPNYVVSISPVSDTSSDVVEIIGVNVSNLAQSFGSSPNHINIDLSSHPNTGWTSSTSPIISTPGVVQNKISQQKCLEYYSTGKKYARRAQVQVFIVGGTSSNQKEFPHMAALGYGRRSTVNNNFLCGGSLISELFVLTAAHCLSAKDLGYVTYVRLGTTTLQTETLNSADYNVIRRMSHPNYIQGKQYDDIALLELEMPVTFTEYISPICLYTSSNLAGANLIAVGWGKTSENGDAAKELQKVNLEYVPNNVCQQAYSTVSKEDLPYGIIESTQLCAGTNDGFKDTCQGDSGGPLQLQQDGRSYLVGITSFGIGCGQPGIPGVYTRVSNYVSWIEDIVW